LFNQREIDDNDHRVWLNEQDTLVNRLRNLCTKNAIKFDTRPTQIVPNKKTVEFWPGDLIQPLEYWQKRNGLYQQMGSVLFVFTDNFIEFKDLDFVKFYSDPTLHFLYCSFDNDCKINFNPSKLYNCFIQRVDSIRQSWFYFLHLRDLLDKGYVSFLLKQLASYSTLTGVDLFDYIHTNYELGSVAEFNKAYTELRPLVPYRNFVENASLPLYIEDSKYSLVLETYANNHATDRWLITEKAIRALCFSAIPLLFMQTRAVEKLKSIGFEIDYHYDLDAVSWIERQQMLLNILENDSIDFDHKHNYNRAMHNRCIGLAEKQRFQNPNYFDEFITKVLEH
jgi:hypothetical protein